MSHRNADVEFIPRRAHDLVVAALQDTRVVAINGPRQCGKSTLAAVVAGSLTASVTRTLDDPEQRELAMADPRTFLEHDGLMVIDEVQRVPDLLLAIKARVDRDTRPGQFLLTGSADLLTSPRIQDALPGRMEIIDLWPLSQGELERTPDGLLEAALGGDLTVAVRSAAPLPRREYFDRLACGGFPEAVRRSGSRRAALHRGWVRNVVERDARDVIDVSRPDVLGRLVELLAAETAGLVVVDRLARELQVAASTVSRYLSVLEQTFLLALLPSWHSGRTSRSVKARKAVFVDSGIASSTLGQRPDTLLDPRNHFAGKLIETFAITELLKQASWSERSPRLHHFRTRDAVEVDLVAEAAGGLVAAFEIKSSATVRDADFRGLRHLKQRLGDRMTAGVVLHAGPTATAWGEHLWALPISALWTTP